MISTNKLEQIKDVIQDCNLNFLIGSGLSAPYLKTLGNIELLLTEVEQLQLTPTESQIIRCSILKHYFDGVMAKNLAVLQMDAASTIPVLRQYKALLHGLNDILLRRRSSLLGKEVNLFTTNIDIFLEKALEDIGLEFNDGFNGRFTPTFSLSNFHKSRFKRSLHFDNVSELPVFNLMKLHGSLTWRLQSQAVVYSPDLANVAAAGRIDFVPGSLISLDEKSTSTGLKSAAAGVELEPCVNEFLNAYDRLLIVNPTKAKFSHTLLNLTYYELLRIFSNELEKDNSVLFVMGFSFADEHIREIVLRAANANPTLLIYIIAYTQKAASEIEQRFGTSSIKNGNIEFIAPVSDIGDNASCFDLATINRELFGKLFRHSEAVATAQAEGAGQ